MRLLLAASIILGLSWIASPTQALPSRCSDMPVAHRGLHTSQPENTKGAVRAAIAAGVPFEVDVRTTSDNKLVLMHDRGVARMTDGSGRVSNMTGRQIRGLTVTGGKRVPYVAAILRLVRDNQDAEVYLDLKTLTRASQVALAQRIRDYGIRHAVTAISFHPQVLAAFHDLNGGVPRYFIAKWGDRPSVDQARRYGGVSVSVWLMDWEWVNAMDAAGVPFSMRMKDDRAAWDQGIRFGTDSIVTGDLADYNDYCPV